MTLDTVLAVAIGIGLAAACGFRVFVPLLVACIAARSGHLPLSPEFAWLESTPALIALATATALEISAYSVPWLDHALDIVATPAAVLAGMVASASILTNLPPAVKWGVALIAGGGAAGIVQGATVLTRLKSTAVTGGLANPIVSFAEFIGSIVTSILAIVVPALVILAVLVFCVIAFRATGLVFGRRAAEAASRDTPR